MTKVRDEPSRLGKWIAGLIGYPTIGGMVGWFCLRFYFSFALPTEPSLATGETSKIWLLPRGSDVRYGTLLESQIYYSCLGLCYGGIGLALTFLAARAVWRAARRERQERLEQQNRR